VDPIEHCSVFGCRASHFADRSINRWAEPAQSFWRTSTRTCRNCQRLPLAWPTRSV